jgi:hypothetical protein
MKVDLAWAAWLAIHPSDQRQTQTMQVDEMLSELATRWLSGLLDQHDDVELWRIALNQILAEVDQRPGILIQVGRCSHWLAPHQARWTADGGFAWPTGYGRGSGGFSFTALPQFDWYFVLEWNGSIWEPVKKRSMRYSLRLTIPSRTKRHRQAAVHTLRHSGREKVVVFYGFRKREEAWVCTASSTID